MTQAAQQQQGVVQQIESLLRARRLSEAEPLCRAVREQYPDRVEGWLLSAKLLQLQGDVAGMREMAEAAIKARKDHIGARLLLAEALLLTGAHDQANARLKVLEQQAQKDPRLLQAIAEIYTHAGAHTAARRCYETGLKQAPGDPGLHRP